MAITATHKDVQISVGDMVKVNYIIKEKDGKDRIQAFDGMILSITGHAPAKSILVQKKASDAIKVERIFPLNSPWIDSITKLRSAKRRVRRAKLYYLREDRVRTL